MQAISVAFRMAMCRYEEMETELLGMPGREVWWNFSGFFLTELKKLTGFLAFLDSGGFI
jgi:hypothetical protein